MRSSALFYALCALTLAGALAQREDDETAEIRSCLSPDLEDQERETCRFYAAVIDAGSTGTRIHVFEFSHDTSVPHAPFHLESEAYKEVKPGLSSFADAPERAAHSVAELLAAARAAIPPTLHAHTPIALKATAGLRLLAEPDANEILYQVEQTIFSSGFLVDENSVGILSGVDEGVFGWFTLNYLLGRLDLTGCPSDSAGCVGTNFIDTGAALDLGGGSTQITFVPADLKATLAAGRLPGKHFSHRLRLFGEDVDFFTHSYLGNGLIAARLGIARLTTHGLAAHGDRNTLYTHCMPNGFRLADWDYAGHKWNVLSSGAGAASLSACLGSARRYIGEVSRVVPIAELNDAPLYAFSYFYDRGVQAGLVTADNQGLIRVADYKRAAEHACARKASELDGEHWRPWQCLDLVYIYALLRYGYGLLDDKQLQLTKKLKNKEVSWALGAGYHLLNTYHERRLNAAASIAASAEGACLTPQTCSRRAWYLRVNGASGGDAQSCLSRNKTGDGKASVDTRERTSGCIFSQLRDYVSEAATNILVLFKLTS